MSDPQDSAEALDDDKFGGDYPPDKLLGAQAYGAAGAEPHATENVTARAAREEPDDLAEALDRAADGIPPEETYPEEIVQEREAPRPAEEAALHVTTDPVDDVDAIEAMDDLDAVTDEDLAAAAELADDPGA
jgi:hypothetical protein